MSFIDPKTFCTQANCPQPQIGHDVAHGAKLLQDFGARVTNNQHPVGELETF